MAEAPRRVFIGLPAYNEEIALPRLLARIEQLIPQLPLTVVVYNDGSTDATLAIARQWQSRMPLIAIDGGVNKGLGAGLRALIAYAVETASDDDVLVVMDCDDTHDPAQIAEMLAAMSQDADVVIGSRYRRGSTVQGVPVSRRVTALGAVLLFKLIHPVRGVRDYTCGYRAYRVTALQKAAAFYGARLNEEAGFACMVEVLLKLNAIGVRFGEIALKLRYDLKPTASKMDVGSNIGRLLKLLIRWRLRGFSSSENSRA
jgi:dolichol-phosphate mannosyltransferase